MAKPFDSAQGRRGTSARYLQPATLARLGTLDLKARTVVEGFLTGLHRSPYRGFSVEFAEYRQYLPGDDLSTLDWKVYARSDRHVVKKFTEDTSLDCHIVLDVSTSMGYGSGEVTKLEYASLLTAALAYLMHRQRDAVGLITFDNRIQKVVAPSARPGHLASLLVALEQQTLGASTDVAKPLIDLAQAVRRRGLVVLVSDLIDDPQRVIDGVRHFRHRGSEVIVFQVLDSAEWRFPFARTARFRDAETQQEVLAEPSAVRERYLASLRELQSRYRQELGIAGIDYVALDTSAPLDAALIAYLQTRRRAW